MLKSVSCDKFICKGEKRPPIVFKEGLNVVLGTDDGKNSNGKSTFLMVLDFVFGGNDYITSKTKNTFKDKNAGHHTINFQFEFNGKNYFFSRNTKEHKTVNVCDSNYNVVEKISIEEYRNKMAHYYGLNKYGITFRQAVGIYTRVYHRPTIEATTPLRQDEKEKNSNEITRIQKLFGKYWKIKEQAEKKDDAEKKKKVFLGSFNQGYIKAAKNKKDFNENIKKIALLKEKIEYIYNTRNKKNNSIDLELMQKINELNKKKEKFVTQKIYYSNQLSYIEQEQKGNIKVKPNTFEELKEFFPNEDLKKLEEIENFHSGIHDLLEDEYKDNKKSLKAIILNLETTINKIDDEKNSLNNTSEISEILLSDMGKLSAQIKTLEEANSNFIKKNNLAEDLKKEKEAYAKLNTEILKDIENKINRKLKSLNDEIFPKTNEPTIKFDGNKKYEFEIEDDSGTGTQYKGLIMFDLAILDLTPVPFVVHDSLLFPNIWNKSIEKIMALYDKQEKQVFIAFDKLSNSTEKTKEIILKNKVLSLSNNGEELFGKAFYKKEN